MIESYRDLKAYSESYKAARAMYKLTRGYPKEEMYGLTGQLRRAALSIPLNIAEGYGKHEESITEFKRYLWMAFGSVNEVQTLLEFSRDEKLITEEHYQRADESYKEIGKMLYGLIKNWK